MGKNIVSLICLCSLTALVACGAPAESPALPPTNHRTEAILTSLPVQIPVLPDSTKDILPFDPKATAVIHPEPTLGPSYEECSQGRYFTVLENWALCDPLADPITIINASNEIKQFSYKDYYGEKIANPCTRLHHLTGDGKYLYFSLDDDCILTEPGFISSISLFRMDLANGKVSETLPASYHFESNLGNTYSVSISPTGRRLAYIVHKTPHISLNILDLQTGKGNTYELDEKYLDGGSFTWSQDGTKLAFMLSNEENYEQFISMSFLDLLRDDSPVVFVNDQDYEWIVSNVEITPIGIKISPPGQEALFYNFDTGILSSAK